MANLLAVVGKSGWGKSTSLLPAPDLGIEGLSSKDTVIYSISGKPLPAKGANKLFPPGTKIGDGARHIHMSDPAGIANAISVIDSKPEFAFIKNIVIEDTQYLQGFTYMSKIKQEGWGRFNDVAEALFLPLQAASKAKRNDLNIVFTFHLEKEDGESKIKTSGKATDQYITVEGLFTVVLFAYSKFDGKTDTSKYYFRTQTDGTDTCKSPPGMFDSYLIPNDMGKVIRKMKEYYD